MSFTFDTSTNIGKVRALIGDVAQATSLLSDEEINVYLSMTTSDIFSSASLACAAIAASKALVAKRKSAGGYSEDLTQIARAYLDLSDRFKKIASEIPAEAVAESFYTDFAYRDILTGKDLRGEDT